LAGCSSISPDGLRRELSKKVTRLDDNAVDRSRAICTVRVNALRRRSDQQQELYGMPRKLAIAIGVLTLMAGAFLPVQPVNAQGVKAGVLSCNVSGGFGFIFGSSRSMNCTFPRAGRSPQNYVGTIRRFGVDIGYIRGGIVVWTVIAPTVNPGPCALAGNYGGASANATVGVGLGANVLVGGSNNSIALQPLSIEGNTGLNVAAGIAAMNLRCRP
jgi:hypothetical protein